MSYELYILQGSSAAEGWRSYKVYSLGQNPFTHEASVPTELFVDSIVSLLLPLKRIRDVSIVAEPSDRLKTELLSILSGQHLKPLDVETRTRIQERLDSLL